ncbi:D-isomer specific 2-hydroxyacid dehydrogenase family protein [Tropicibacter sp. Alg240-R139]|uniref:NAD(P)-dependent oxidoreductase n=1 Tax=Tropicibacter sp. Alg240-R139 TaxID=2305991 RepID=UPI0013DFE1DC|nr:NAD(P)-dependent oxidoreductase [Tropicibacter sp. Alg240-R139]
MRIFSTHPLDPDVTRELCKLGDYHVAATPSPQDILRDSLGAEIIVVRAPIDPQIIRRETGLRALVRHGAGLDMIPIDVATQVGALVANVPGANAVTVAEHVVWSALSLLRRNPEVTHDLQRNGWEAGRQHSVSGREMSGKTLGIIGFGNIGSQIEKIATRGFGMKIVATTRTPSRLPETVQALTLTELLKTADIVALTCPLNEETRGLIDASALQNMKPRSVLVNVSRGPVIEETALIDALKSGHLSGAALDVFSSQPLPSDHPLMVLNNVILTPHMAGITEESMRRMGEGVVKEARLILSGELPDNFCNPAVESAYREKFG